MAAVGQQRIPVTVQFILAIAHDDEGDGVVELVVRPGLQRLEHLAVVGEADDLGVDLTPRLKVIKVAEPPKRQGGGKVKTVQELVEKLVNEAKVI